jgi:hypothetical protein
VDHPFTPVIMSILKRRFGKSAEAVFAASPLLQYLNTKTKSASRGSKARSAFANHYALYVLVEDYVLKGFLKSGSYRDYEGARFADLFIRQRELPFGSKLQNHALNHRLNEEFKKYFPTCQLSPIMRNPETNRYWIAEGLLLVKAGEGEYNIAKVVMEIIEAYIEEKQRAFSGFIKDCERIAQLQDKKPGEARDFIASLLKPNIDARVFEIVSFSILKRFYGVQSIFWGWREDEIEEDSLVLYETGRTNANDGGIDFVMKPLGRFFQVTETVDARKYFLDIDKIERFPITFVVKSADTVEGIRARIEAQAIETYRVRAVVKRYMDCIEEVINIPVLMERFDSVVKGGGLPDVVSEIVRQSKVEFNVNDDE